MRKKRHIKKNKKKLLKYKVLGFFVALLTLVFLISAFTLIAAAVQDVPKLADLTESKAETGMVFAADGSLLTLLYATENRQNVVLKDIPKSMQDAVVAIEDERFYQHKGVDWQAVARAAAANLSSGTIVEGGSTITQQYVKNTFITPERTFKRKINEAFLASEVEDKYTKPQILEKYLNTIYFGQGAYGVEAAAQTFFSKQATQLTLEESALLAGLIRAPNTYSPYNDPLTAKNRRDTVLRQMVTQKMISQASAEAIILKPLAIRPPKQNVTKAPYFVEYVKQQILDDPVYGSTPTQRYNYLFKRGLRIYTTIDMNKQAAAESAISGTLNRPTDPSAALVSLEPNTGYIRAMVGGKDFNASKFNLATQGKRQPGSSFKTFVLVAALERGFSPYKVYPTGPITISLPGEDWKVANYSEGKGGPPLTIVDGTKFSVNGLYARLMMDVGTKNVIKVAKKMGIKTELPQVPSIALGAAEVTPLEMASAYGSLATMGYHVEPTAIIKITDSKGTVLRNYTPKRELAVTPSVAWTATQVLSQVMCCGTGTKASIGRPAAGKTGTAQEYRDAWFVGYTPTLSTSVWVGYPGSQREMKNVHGIRVAGGTFPAIIWGKYMRAALKGTPVAKFVKPKGGKNLSVFGSGDLEKVPQAKYKVPAVTGAAGDSAVQALWDAGFKVNRVFEPSDTVAKDIVISQSPEAGASGAAGTSVTIVVSSGPAETTTTLPGDGSSTTTLSGDTGGGGNVDGNNDGEGTTTTTAAPPESTTTTTLSGGQP